MGEKESEINTHKSNSPDLSDQVESRSTLSHKRKSASECSTNKQTKFSTAAGVTRQPDQIGSQLNRP